jgi:hypothetical protein
MAARHSLTALTTGPVSESRPARLKIAGQKWGFPFNRRIFMLGWS